MILTVSTVSTEHTVPTVPTVLMIPAEHIPPVSTVHKEPTVTLFGQRISRLSAHSQNVEFVVEEEFYIDFEAYQ